MPQSLRFAGKFSEDEMKKEMGVLKAMYQDQHEKENYQQNNVGQIIDSIKENKNKIEIKQK